MPDIERPVSGYEQIASELKRQIEEGDLTQGQRVPSARELAEDWNVSPGTAARALRLLVTARLVRQDHRGTFVLGGSRAAIGPQARHSLTRFPPAERVVVTAAAYLERAPAYVQPVLGLEPLRADGLCPVIRREEVRYGPDGRPVSLMTEWVPPRYAESCPELSVPEPLPFAGGAIALVEARTGTRAARGRESHEARVPQDDDREMPLLYLSPADPVLGQVWIWYGPDDEPMTYTEMTLPAGRVIETTFSP
jgi:DNA-binding GntR family transcriptional regulator